MPSPTETEIRGMLQRRAGDVTPPALSEEELVRRAAHWRRLNLARTAGPGVAVALIGLAAAVVVPHGGEITLADVRQHVSCMRAHGVDLPDPVAQPGGGWSVIVADPEAAGLSLNNPDFRRAWLDCGPPDAGVSGDIVLAGPRDEIERFVSCMRDRDFNLPAPANVRGDEWRFDLRSSDIDPTSRAWNEAMFGACAPRTL